MTYQTTPVSLKHVKAHGKHKGDITRQGAQRGSSGRAPKADAQGRRRGILAQGHRPRP